MFNSPLTYNDLSRSNQAGHSTSSNAASQPGNAESTSYLPGYLSSAARGSSIPISTPPRQSVGQQGSVSVNANAHSSQQSLSRSPLSTSQTSAHTPSNVNAGSVSGGAFGAGSLFGSISTPLSKSPRNSLYGRIEDDQEAPPTMFLQDEENVHVGGAGSAGSAPSQNSNTAQAVPSAQQIHNLTPWHHAAPTAPQQSPVETRSVTFFGVPDAARARIMDIFIPQLGAVESVHDGTNWVDVVFADAFAASRALKWNGCVVDELGGIMLGVKMTHGSASGGSGEQPSAHTSTDHRKHLSPLPPSQAFKPSPKPQSSTTTLRTMFNSPSASKNNEFGITPQQAQTQSQNRGSWGGKLADLIFGF
ncbi:hypothetical protein E3P99_01487 [Wallemia hederae]|uniref:RRM Nup35-type domain-containing protein n=1 Tax=Wallemia hederae TaxID=1540922 RepID=A0A4T0FU98_9BASI|nr:hypothetical protein E3P99_01487 [Wallemia hederae]